MINKCGNDQKDWVPNRWDPVLLISLGITRKLSKTAGKMPVPDDNYESILNPAIAFESFATTRY